MAATCAACGHTAPEKEMTRSRIRRGKWVCRNPNPCIARQTAKDQAEEKYSGKTSKPTTTPG
jgi:hypothetical protein